ncbi:MAG: alpha/beta fold hydrolase [Gemmatimonadetes bacterium]|nr:alpha/beta fold hydrolase [Gemmatimonadota bacterium]
MSLVPAVQLRIYPDDCDAYGHVNQAAFLRLFERARWEALALGPGTDVFTRAGAWPAIRKANVEYYAAAFPGEALRFDLSLTQHGKTSFSMHQLVRRVGDGRLIAAGEFTAVCIDAQGRPTPVPPAVTDAFGVRSPLLADPPHHLVLGDRQLTIDLKGDGPGILFIHGFPMDRTLWRPLVAGLPGWRRMAPDLPGFGLSDAFPDGTATIARYADDMVRVLDDQRVDRAVVCGLSLGGYVAFQLWRAHPDRVRAFVLISTRAEGDNPDGRTKRNEMIEQIRTDGVRGLADTFFPRLLAAATVKAEANVAGHVRTMLLDNQVGGLEAAVAAMRDREDSTQLLSTVSVPSLIVAGSEDVLIPGGTSRALAVGIKGSRFETVMGAGHVAPLEQPDATVEIVSDFLESML